MLYLNCESYVLVSFQVLCLAFKNFPRLTVVKIVAFLPDFCMSIVKNGNDFSLLFCFSRFFLHAAGVEFSRF